MTPTSPAPEAHANHCHPLWLWLVLIVAGLTLVKPRCQDSIQRS